MDSVPKVSDSRRVGREAATPVDGCLSSLLVVGRAPGVNVAGAKICFMVDIMILDLSSV